MPAGGTRTPIRLPVTIVRRGEGPAVLLAGGNHGDEYEGPIAILKLIKALEPEQQLSLVASVSDRW